MRSSSSSRIPSSPAAPAQSSTSPKAKAVWLCSPHPDRVRQLGQPLAQAFRGARLERPQDLGPALRLGLRPLAELGGELEQPGQAVGPLEGRPALAVQVGRLGGDLLRGQAPVQRVAGRLRERLHPGRSEPGGPAASGRAPPSASRSSRRRPASVPGAAGHPHRIASRVRSCSGTPGARSPGPGGPTAPQQPAPGHPDPLPSPGRGVRPAGAPRRRRGASSSAWPDSSRSPAI